MTDAVAALLFALATWCARLPWRVLDRIGDGIAWLWWRLDARESRVARRNLELTYPELLPGQRADLHRRVLRTTGRQALATLRLWTQPRADSLALLRETLHRQGGNVSVATKPLRYTQFTLRLPLRDTASARPRPSRRDSAGASAPQP